MKQLIIILMVISFSACTVTKTLVEKKVLYDAKKILLVQEKDKSYTLTNKRTKEVLKLKFIRWISESYQVLDKDNKIFYINNAWDIKEKVTEYIGFCGTVPQWTLKIVDKGIYFEVLADETFYDQNNTPAEAIMRISKEEADEIMFINGKTKFFYTENHGLGFGAPPPRMLIFKKNGKYFTKDDPTLQLDAIDFSKGPFPYTQKGNLYGLLSIVKPKYKSIGAFDYFLAKVEKEDGTVAYIDTHGNEY